ncbi:MAG: YggT family protein [Pseudomonadota bacterium]|jgi:YggT family protein|nr:MAG: YggT family protein [Pseudomonadota bacterium]
MRALHFLLDTLATLYIAVILLRLLLQLVRADFRNPIARAIVQVSNPVVLPLRRVLPPLGKVDTASVVAVVLCTVLKLWILSLLFLGTTPGAALLARWTLLDVAQLVLRTYQFSIFVNALLSFVAPGNYSPAQSLLSSLCEPVLRPFRRIVPPIGGIDLSPLWALLAIQALLILLN